MNAPTIIHCQVTDDENSVKTLFSCPQDPEVWPMQVEMKSDDPRYVAFYEAQSDVMKVGLVRPGE
ncbi:hypothetical protein [Cupriavidus campinensis]|uniref:Uncharacterized protein n=1 Tax=Cupriavidus campinensis TaxID=151783 RepID=A0AAE9I2L7_9BURK|nr:hypothetical protein [Cupriavidus campinensis]URF02781.1 hypothetical protein M5D45_09360 [Cupriavidus campinensis]